MSLRKVCVIESEKEFLSSFMVSIGFFLKKDEDAAPLPLAKSLAAMIKVGMPVFSNELINATTNNSSVVTIDGLPKCYGESTENLFLAKTLSLCIALLVGEPFQYQQQNQGKIVADITPVDSLKETQSSGGIVEFGWHTDDAFFTPDVRTD